MRQLHPSDSFAWPTDGYDSVMVRYQWDESDPFKWAGSDRETWLAVADEMIRRWTAFRETIRALPPQP